MPRLDDEQYEKGSSQKVILFGPPKSGKTQLIGELASEYELIFFDLEDGKDTLLKLPKEIRHNVIHIPIRDTVDEPRAHATIDKIVKGGIFNICDDHGTVDCIHCNKDATNDRWTEVAIPTNRAGDNLKKIVVIDSGSQLTVSINSTVNKHMGRSVTIDSVPERAKNWGDEWDFQGKYLNRILTAIQNAPFHCIVTAHEIEAEREDGGIRMVPSIGTKNYAVNVAKFFGHVIYLDKVNLKHKAFSDTGYSNKVLTGSRLDVALEGMDKPSLLPIFKGEYGTGKNNRQQQATAVLKNVTDQMTGSSNSSNSSNQPTKPAFTLAKK